MGKSWLDRVSLACLTPGRDKKHQKKEKEKRKWFGRQKSKESIEFHVEETPPTDPSSSSVTITRPCPPPPPPLPDFAPQPLLPPPSPPPHHPVPTASVASANNKGYADFKDAKTRQALALASAVAAEAAVVAAKAAAEVVRLTSTTSTHQVVESKGEAAAEAAVVAAKAAAEVVHLTTTTSTHEVVESKGEAAAIKIQNAYRGYKARRTLHMLRGMGRLKTLLQGRYVKRQMNVMLSSMRTLTRLQLQIQERRSRLSEDNRTRHRLIQKKGHQKEHNQNQNLVVAGDFDYSNKSKEQIQARSSHQKDASLRRERALAYAYSHQQTWRKSSKLPHQKLMNPNTPDWGWCWLERWMASRPWDPDQVSFKNSLKRENSIKTSPARSKTLKPASQNSIQRPTNIDSKRKKCEGTNHKQSIIGESSGRVKDDEIIGSVASHRSYLANTQTTKSKVSVDTISNLSSTQPLKKPKATKGNLDNTEASKSKISVGTTRNLVIKQALKSKVNVGTTSNVGLQNKKVATDKEQNKKVVTDKEKPPQIVLSKKRLSSSTSLGTTKKLSDSDKAITGVADGEKKRRNVRSS